MKPQAEKIIREVLDSGRKNLTEHESKELLRAYNIPVSVTKVAKTASEAVKIAEEVGYPVVLKVLSPKIIHKSDIQGVQVNLRNKGEVLQAFKRIMENAKLKVAEKEIWGVTVQKYYLKGREAIVGVINDPQFGPTLMFGLGGIFVEIYRDVSFRVLPVTSEDIEEMIKEVKGYKILEGYRGEKPIDFSLLKDLLFKVSEMALNIPLIKEMDLNPVALYENLVVVLDARVVLK